LFHIIQDNFEHTKGVIRNHKSNTDWQAKNTNGQAMMKKHRQLKIEQSKTKPTKTAGELRGSRMVCIFCFISGTRRVKRDEQCTISFTHYRKHNVVIIDKMLHNTVIFPLVNAVLSIITTTASLHKMVHVVDLLHRSTLTT
jgi:hypothetical protein